MTNQELVLKQQMAKGFGLPQFPFLIEWGKVGPRFAVPDEIRLKDLAILFQSEEGKTHCNIEPLRKILQFNGVQAHTLQDEELPQTAWFFYRALVSVYLTHLEEGGETNAFLASLDRKPNDDEPVQITFVKTPKEESGRQ